MSNSQRVCPASSAPFLTIGLRRLFQNPAKILGNLVSRGQTVVDLGCGPGFFTLDMARIVGDDGRVIAVDMQQAMLDILARRARDSDLDSKMEFHLCESDRIGLTEPVDFVLAFYMVHEVPDPNAFMQEVYDMLSPNGILLLVEPKFHVSGKMWDETLELATHVGFNISARPNVVFSRSVLLKKSKL